MKKTILVVLLVFSLAVCSLWAGGTMDASMVSETDVAKIERIVQDLDPEAAIQTALNSFPKSSFPLNDYLKTQEMKINRIFNEYGVEFDQYTTYEGLKPKAQIAFTKLKSRYSYLGSMKFNNPDELRSALVLLKN